MASNPTRPVVPEPNHARRPSANADSRKPTGGGHLEDQADCPEAPGKKKKHRGGKKHRGRKQSFASGQEMGTRDMSHDRPGLPDVPENSSFYQLHNNLSNTSLESEALLDHRGHPTIRTRRPSVPVTSIYQQHTRPSFGGSPQRFPSARPSSSSYNRSRFSDTTGNYGNGHKDDNNGDDDDDADDRTPLMSSSSQRDVNVGTTYDGVNASVTSSRPRRLSRSSMSSSRLGLTAFTFHHSETHLPDYDVNNPPSVPTSPAFRPNAESDNAILKRDPGNLSEPARSSSRSLDALINIDEPNSRHASPTPGDLRRRMTATALEDVCFPHETMSELAHDDYHHSQSSGEPALRRRRRRWPDLGILEVWSHEEKEQRQMEGMRMRKVSEPLMVEGRLRPRQRAWHREASDVPYRFTYFNETFDNTIHSQSISELLQPGQTFKHLFVPDPPLLEDSSEEETDDEEDVPYTSTNGHGSQEPTRSSSKAENQIPSGEQTRSNTPRPADCAKAEEEKPKRYGPRPAWWLDVMAPTEAEMMALSKAFGIHPLTSEDILMQEQREKVELFKHYYFINYRTFEQDESSEDYLDPVNLYVVVFREGVISFHFSMTPHPANVRRRIRQLSDYLVLSPDWISYAIIDDITDAYAPMIQKIEEEVDSVDEIILRLHSVEEQEEAEKSQSSAHSHAHHEKKAEGGHGQDSGRDMLRRIGECRKKVMSLYRLLGNKADVIKGFAKRCNDQWGIAPRNEIGMYLGDIQDHIVTMTGNLSHYENLLSRAHSNYLAQINIRMNERQEKTSDILGKLTVLGTIVLPMNVVTGIWGMNCLVPGQNVESLTWFFCITGGLIGFGLLCYFIAKRIYGIV